MRVGSLLTDGRKLGIVVESDGALDTVGNSLGFSLIEGLALGNFVGNDGAREKVGESVGFGREGLRLIVGPRVGL